MSTSTLAKTLLTGDMKSLWGFAAAVTMGVLAAVYPLVILPGLLACLVLYGVRRWCRDRLELWQALVLLAMTPYVLLNYGFDNLAVGGSTFGFPIGELFMFSAFILVILGKQHSVLHSAIVDRVSICVAVLLVLSCAHLMFDVSRYGLYALRDASMLFEGIFLILGVLWGQNQRSTQFLMRWLFFVFLVNLFYSYTFPWKEKIQALSPNSGVFHPVPLFGNYQESALWLVLGAPFLIWLGPSIVRWPRWVLVGLAAAQLGGLAMLQARSMYVSIAVIFLILLLLGETKKLFSFVSTVGWGILFLAVLLLVVSALGIEIEGRMGRVDFSFVADQVKTVLNLGDANARMSHDVDRAAWYQQTWDRVRSSPSNFILGEGFGQPLIDFVTEDGIAVRQPHNSSLTVLARLGSVGLSVWLAFIVVTFVRYIQVLRKPYSEAGVSVLILWLFCHFVVSLLNASVQPSFEFSHGAIPFFFLQGLAIGMLQRRSDTDDLPFIAASTSLANY